MALHYFFDQFRFIWISFRFLFLHCISVFSSLKYSWYELLIIISVFSWGCFFLWYFIVFKACVCYFLSKFYFSPNDSPSKTMENVFCFIWKALFVLKIFKFLYFCLPLFFFPVSHCFRDWFKKNLQVYDVTNCLDKNLTTHLEKEISCDIKTLCIDRVLNKEHFYGKIMQKICTKS